MEGFFSNLVEVVSYSVFFFFHVIKSCCSPYTGWILTSSFTHRVTRTLYIGLVLQQHNFQEQQEWCSYSTVLGGRCKEMPGKGKWYSCISLLTFPVGNKHPPRVSVVDAGDCLGSLCLQKSLESWGNILKNRLGTAVFVLGLGTECLIPPCPCRLCLQLYPCIIPAWITLSSPWPWFCRFSLLTQYDTGYSQIFFTHVFLKYWDSFV